MPCSNGAAAAAGVAAPLFQPYRLPSGKELQHRIVYAPLTRCRAFNNIPQASTRGGPAPAAVSRAGCLLCSSSICPVHT